MWLNILRKKQRFAATIVAGITVAIILTGCSAVSVLELQDAETVRPGAPTAYAGASFGPDMARLYLDSSGTLGGLYVPLAEFGARMGLGQQVDVGLGGWTSTLLYAPATSFQTADLGVRASVRWMITNRGAVDRVALGVTGWWYGSTNAWVNDNSALRAGGVVYGFGPSLLYSMPLDRAEGDTGAALYGGLKWMAFRARIDYAVQSESDSIGTRHQEALKTFADNRAAYAIFAGIGRAGRSALEIAAMITPRLDARLTTWSLYAGVRLPIGE
jgi:hypothetical protein